MTRRVPVTTQVTATECGICCVASVLAAHGRHESMTELRADLEIGRDGATVDQLGSLLLSRGMQVRLLEASSIEALRVFDIPVVLFWEGNHFVVLERMTRRGAILMDPAMGRRRVTLAELAQAFSGIVILTAPGDDFAPRKRRFLAEWRSFPLVPRGAVAPLVWSLLLAVVGYGVTAVMPVAVQWTVDSLVHPDAQGRLMAVLLAAPAAALVYFALQAVRTLILTRTLALVGGHLMETILGHLLTLPYKYFTTRQVGELLYRLGSVSAVRDLVSTKIVSGVLDIGIAVVMLSYVFWVSPTLGLITAAIFALCLGLLIATQRPLTEVMDTEIAHLSKAQAIEYDAVSSIAAIKMGGYRSDFFDRWKTEYDNSLRAMRRRMHVQDGLVGGLLGAVQVFGPLLLVAVALMFTVQGALTVGTAVAVQGVGALLLGLSSGIFGSWSDFVQSCRLMRRVLDITESESEPNGTRDDELELPTIEVDNVGFAYNRGGAEVLMDVTLDVSPGEKVAIVGASGSGKSTLALLICALHFPTRGSVRVGGTDVTDWNLDRLRGQVGYVPQDIRLHDASIVDNLRLGTPLGKEETVARCAELPFLDFIDELPMGYETVVTEQGANFSGGQRQRLAIARALLRDPRIVVFDEATSALDTVSERLVTDHLTRLGCTQVVLAHRLSTIRACDRIHVLDGGRVIESGTHDDLVARGGTYATLYAADHETEHSYA